MRGFTIGGVIFGFVALMGIFAFFGSFYTIDERERGVLLRNGAVIGTVGPGLHFKLPFVDDVEYLDMQTQNVRFEGEPSYSKDQQEAGITLSVSYRLLPDKAVDIYKMYTNQEGVETRIIHTRVRRDLKEVFGQFNAATAISERSRLGAEVQEAITEGIGAAGILVIESVQIENIDFSAAYEESIEARMLAEVEVQKLRQNAEREKVQAQIVVTQAQATADSTLAKAKAEAQAIELRGNAEALAINARGKALRDNPDVVALTTAERWDGKLPTAMIPSGTVPFLNVAPTP